MRIIWEALLISLKLYLPARIISFIKELNKIIFPIKVGKCFTYCNKFNHSIEIVLFVHTVVRILNLMKESTRESYAVAEFF